MIAPGPTARARAYLAEHPDATGPEVARATGAPRQIVHRVRSGKHAAKLGRPSTDGLAPVVVRLDPLTAMALEAYALRMRAPKEVAAAALIAAALVQTGRKPTERKKAATPKGSGGG